MSELWLPCRRKNAGALLADESPIRCSRLFCTRWNGLNKSGGVVDALDDAEYSGSVISLIENGEAFIKRNCKWIMYVMLDVVLADIGKLQIISNHP